MNTILQIQDNDTVELKQMKAIAFLNNGAVFMHYTNKMGVPPFTEKLIMLSQDEQFIEYRLLNENKLKQIAFGELVEIRLGCDGPGFKKSGKTSDVFFKNRCFVLCFKSTQLELEATTSEFRTRFV